MKKLFTLILAVMLLCSLALPAFADSTIDLTQTGSVNLWKYDLTSAQADGVWDSSYVSTGIRDQSGVEAILGASGSSSGYAIEGVVYTYLKVAELKSVTVTDNDVERSELMYGIANNAANTAFLAAIGVSANDRYAAADETNGDVTTYYYRSDTLIAGLQNALTSNATTVKNALETYVVNNGGTTMPATDANGHSVASDLPLGLYLFVETSVPEMVTSTTAPFLISIPMTYTTASGSSWIYDEVVYPKNLTGLPTLDKTVREAKTSSGKNNGSAAITDGFEESATASAGDTVEYQIISTLPSITSAASYLSQYTFVDTLSPGITYKKNDVVLEFYSEAACTKKIATWTADSEKFTVGYTTGTNGESIMTIAMTAAGLNEINTSSAVYTGASAVNSGYSDCTLRITYGATLGTDNSLILGDTGNPNEVTLTWKRSNTSFYDTLTDDAAVYSFGMDVTKNFSDGRGDATKVEFLIQNSTDSYYLTGSFNTTENVWYVTGKTAEASSATRFVPTAAGKLTVKGLEDDAYTLTEVKTDSAYTLLKAPVQVVISKSGATVSATVDGKAVNMSANGTSGHALAPFTIINTRGFDLPQTGGTGNWLFPVIGMVMLAACITGIVILAKKPRENG